MDNKILTVAVDAVRGRAMGNYLITAFCFLREFGRLLTVITVLMVPHNSHRQTAVLCRYPDGAM